MSGLLSLPVELLTEIAELVPHPIDLTAVCQRLNDVATPVAYRALTLPQFQAGPYDLDRISRIMAYLLRTMMAQPSLGMHVRYFEIILPCSNKYLIKSTKIPADVRIPAVEAAHLHGLSESVVEQLAEGFLSATLFLLLCYFPNLDSLHLVTAFEDDFFDLVATSSLRTLPCGLRSLRSVCVRDADMAYTRREDIFALFRLPSLRIVKCHIFEPLHYRRGAPTSDDQLVLFGGVSQIEDIDIWSDELDTWVLEAMIRSVQSLRSFRYVQGGDAHIPFLGALLGRALRAHAHTLENLELHVIDILYQYETSIGSLCNFDKLTRLSISMSVLLGDPSSQDPQNPSRIGGLLPPSLVTLDVCVDGDWRDATCGCLTQFIQVDLDHVPNLKRLSLGIRGDFHISDLDTAPLLAACVASGIEFGVAELPHYR